MAKIIKASTIAEFLTAKLIGPDLEVKGVGPANQIKAGELTFLTKSKYSEQPDIQALYLIKTDRQPRENSTCCYIQVANPRLAFAKVVQQFFTSQDAAVIAKSAKLGKNAKVSEGVAIGDNCVIGDNVTIGQNTRLNQNIVIAANTVIGADCYFKSGSIIGEDGFGFDFESDGTPVRLPHLGKVVIGNNVEIGANCTIARGTLTDTVIADNVKIDDQVHVAHNCSIGQNTIITAQAEISGSVKIKAGCWLGPNCSIMQKVTIGYGATVGLGAVVTNDVPDKKKIMGLEALSLRDLLRLKKQAGLRND